MIDPLTRLATAARNSQIKEASDFLRPCWRSLPDSRTWLEALLPLTLEAVDLREPDLATVKLVEAVYHVIPDLPGELQLPLLDAFVKHLASMAKVSLPLAEGQIAGYFKAQKPREGFLQAIAQRRVLNAFFYAEREIDEASATAFGDLCLQVAARAIGPRGQLFTSIDSLVWLSGQLAPSDQRYATFRLAELLAGQAAPEAPASLSVPKQAPEQIVAAAAHQAGFFGTNLILAHRIQRRSARLGPEWSGHLWAQLEARIEATASSSEDDWSLDDATLAVRMGRECPATTSPAEALADAIKGQQDDAALVYLDQELQASGLSSKLLSALIKGALGADRDPLDPHSVILPWAAWSLARQAEPALARLMLAQVVLSLANLQTKQLGWTYRD